MNIDHAVIDGETASLLCKICRTFEPVPVPMATDALVTLIDSFLAAHAGCATSSEWADMQAAAHQARTELGANADAIALINRTVELLDKGEEQR